MRLFRPVVLAALLLTSGQACALKTDDAGMIKSTSGSVTLQRGAATLKATPGMAVKRADILRTGPSGLVGVTLLDNTLISAGPNSELSLDRFQFDSKTQKGELQATLKHGSLSSISGTIAKTSPDAVRFKTSSMTLGVRGTRFILEATE